MTERRELMKLAVELARETSEYPRGESTSLGERRKETREALDAVLADLAFHDSLTGQELYVDVVRRLVSADPVVRREATRWVEAQEKRL